MRWLVFSIFILSFFSCKNDKPDTSQKRETVEEALERVDYQYEIRQPKVAIQNPPLLILLHGYGSNEKDLFAWADYLDERFVVICPRGVKDLGQGRYSWFELQSSEEGLRYDSKEVLNMANDIATFTFKMMDKYNIDPEKVFLGGFSQGGILSLGTGVMFEDKINHVLCLSGSLYRDFGRILNQRKDDSNLNVFLSHGRNDTVLPFKNIEDYVSFMKEKGVNIEAKFYDSNHSVSTQNFKDMLGWLDRELK